MNVRRALGALITTAVIVMTLQPLPAFAAPQLGVLIVDPLVGGSLGSAGTTPFDATTFSPPSTNDGTSAGPTTHVIRTNDIITYDIQYSVNGGNANGLELVSTLPTNGGVPVANYTGYNAGVCSGAGSGYSNGGQTLTCVVGFVSTGSAQEFTATVQVLASTPNGFTLTPSITVSDTVGADGFSPVTATGYSLGQGDSSTGVDAYDTVTSISKADIVKTTPNLTTNYFANASSVAGTTPQIVSTYNGEGGVPGYYLTYPVLAQEGTGAAGSTSGVGIAPAPSPISVTDTLTPPLGAVLPAANKCGPNGSGITIPGIPYGYVGVVGSATTNNSVAAGNTQSWTCSISSGVITIAINGASTLGTTYPQNNVVTSAPYGPGVESATWIIAGYVRVFVPTSGLGGVAQTFADAYSSISLPVTNGTVTETLPVQPPPGGSGSISKQFVANTSETQITPQISGSPNIPAVNSSEEVVAAFNVSNTTTAALGDTDMIDDVACDTINPAEFAVTNFDGTTGPAVATWGGAVNITGANTATGLTVQYGDGTSAADCGASNANPSSVTTGWYASTALVPGGVSSIARVRVLATIAVGQQLHVQINETVAPSLTAGTPLSNTVTNTGTPSAAGSGVANGAAVLSQSATAPARIFQDIISARKQLFKNTSGASLFNQGTPGSGGFVDDNQEFVAFLDTNGSQTTLTSTGTITCDTIDLTKYTMTPFDGTTGAANATYGGPVAFSGTPPAGTVVEYSTNSTDSTCRAGTWLPATGALPAWNTITRVRATFDLPPVTTLRMYVNLLANAGLAAGTVLNNVMVTSNAAAPSTPITASNSTTIETEILGVTKTGPTGEVAAGTPGTFSITPTIQGVGAAQSGTVTLTDTLPSGLAYVTGSATLTPPSGASTYIPGSGSATEVSVTTDPVTHITTVVWNVGKAGPSPGNIVTMPTITYSAIPSITLSDGTHLMNTVVVSESDPGIATASATATVIVSNPGAFHISKLTTTPQISTGGTISWQLSYANTGASSANSTDFIDELPYPGDTRGSAYHGTLVLATATGTNGETFRYTKATHGTINEDPGCVSNGGSVAPGVGLCQGPFAVTVWCPSLSGGTCPASLAEVTALRIGGGPLPGGSGARTITVTATTSGNIFTDQYWNNFGGRMDISTQGVLAPPVETIVPIPANPFVTLVKSCLAPPTCTSAAQAPGTDITYGIVATNTGGHVASLVTITDPIPANMDFKLGTASAPTVPASSSMVITYSSNGTTFVYTPVSGGGGAATGYDRNVLAVRWTLATGSLAASGPNNTCTVQFTAAIR